MLLYLGGLVILEQLSVLLLIAFLSSVHTSLLLPTGSVFLWAYFVIVYLDS